MLTIHRIHSTQQWLSYFQYNRNHLMPLPWDCTYRLSASETQRIARSIQNFQLGESSEGAHLMKVSRLYAQQTGDRHWVDLIKLFIGEEQRHAKDLSRFMAQNQIPAAKRHWSDTLFRKFRQLADLEVALMVLFTAELVATLYYRSLGNATQSPLLQALCRQIVHDETYHVQFQAESIARLRQQQLHFRRSLTEALHALFFRATLVVVWLDHAPIFKADGYRFWQFFHAACREFDLAQSHIHNWVALNLS